jgi:hypothetical protein
LGFYKYIAPTVLFRAGNGAKLSLFDHLNSSKTIENLHFIRTNRLLAARIDLCPHGAKAGSHGTANCPHGLNFARTNRKMAARNDLLPHGTGIVPHRLILTLRQGIFARTNPC